MLQSRSVTISEETARLLVALQTADDFAAKAELGHRDCIHLRLLTEETMGMLRTITGSYLARLWFEEEDGVVRLCLELKTEMNEQKRSGLMSLVKGKEKKEHGIMDHVLITMDGMLRSEEQPAPWSLSDLREQIRNGSFEDKDILERSIVGNIAEEIEVYVHGFSAFMTITLRK